MYVALRLNIDLLTYTMVLNNLRFYLHTCILYIILNMYVRSKHNCIDLLKVPKFQSIDLFKE